MQNILLLLSFLLDDSVTFSPTDLVVESATHNQEIGTKFDTSYSCNEGKDLEFFKMFLVPWESSADGNGKYVPLIPELIGVPPTACLLCYAVAASVI